MNLVTPKAEAKHELLFNEPASKAAAKLELFIQETIENYDAISKLYSLGRLTS
jgi:hypothetical protein